MDVEEIRLKILHVCNIHPAYTADINIVAFYELCDALIKIGAEREREACAKVCEEIWENMDCASGDHPFASEYAAAIRARGEK